MPKTGYALVLFALLGIYLLTGGCVKSTDPFEGGRVFIFFDLDPAKVKAGYGVMVPGVGYRSRHFYLGYQVEGEEPVEIVTGWEEHPTEFDLIGRSIEGGKEVSVWIAEQTRATKRVTFKVNGNAHLRVRFLDPEKGGAQSEWVLERLL